MTTNRPDKEAITLDYLRTSLESLRTRMIDLEALSHAAADTIDHIPYLPRLPYRGVATKPATPVWSDKERRNLGRMQALVFASADSAERVLTELDAIIEDLYRGYRSGGNGQSGGAAPEGGEPSGGPDDDESLYGSTEPREDSERAEHDSANGSSHRDPALLQGRVSRHHTRAGIALDARAFPPALG